MKLKAIMYALGYGKSRKQLVRSEGARRVKQAENLMNLRKLQKTLSFVGNYGSDGSFNVKGMKERSVSAPKTFGTLYGSNSLTLEQFAQARGMSVGEWLQESSNNVVGLQYLEVDFSETERKIASWVSGRKAGKEV